MKVALTVRSMSPKEITEACGGTLTYTGNSDKIMVNAICTDSREAYRGTMFIALKGEKTDGHNYIGNVLSLGCQCVLCEKFPEENYGGDCAVITVKDSLKAIGDIAALYCKDAKCRRIAITGSVGKTTTKEYISAVLSQKYPTCKTPGNHNSWLGMPMAMLGEASDCRMSVLEMGMSAPGEIAHLSKTAKPDIAVITNIGTAHLEILKTRENICRAKLEITEGLKKGGILVLNGDEPLLRNIQKDISEFRVLYVSLENDSSDFRATNIVRRNGKTVFDLVCRNKTVKELEINELGKHNVLAASYAYAVGDSLGLEEDTIRSGLLSFCNTGMRQNIYGFDGKTVIEDCYNASPESMLAAASVLSELAQSKKNARKIAVLGDMRELGERSDEMHRQVGRYFYGKGTDILFTFGENAKHIAEGAAEMGMSKDNIFVNADTDNPALTAYMLSEKLKDGDIVLFKASRAVAEERIIQLLKDNKQR